MPLVINGETVDDSEIREEAAALRPRYEELVEGKDPVAMEMQLRDWSRENVIERVLLRQDATRDRVAVPEGMTPEAEAQHRVQLLVGRITLKVPPPKQKDVADSYRKNRDRFWSPEMVRASHIVKNVDENTAEDLAREAIEKTWNELKAGADFAELADRDSDCPGSGGDLGWIEPGQMVDEFERVAFGLGVGETSAIFRTVFGFHIAKVHGRRAAGVRSLADARSEIEAALLRERQERALEEYMDGLKAKAVIQNVRTKST
ncbi:MAG: peptidyl-prolyl cis-trans isomerase [Acidobacteriota bacterium]|nr:peptidyl-prolyl cis-trans isomerase [Acidobacteriota bacterium]